MKTWLIDGSGYIYRSFYSLPAMSKTDGTPVGAIYGYCEMLHKLIGDADCTHMAVILDGGRSGREAIDAGYKANRPERPPELTAQLKMLADATAAHGIPSIRIDGMEADDVIHSYAQEITANGGEVTVYSSDKDLLPLLSMQSVSIFDPLKKQWITPEVCAERFGVTPDQMTDYLAMVGDSSDNIPGVPKIGAKGAAKLLQDHYDLDTILDLAERAPEHLSCGAAQRASLRDNKDQAIKSRDLVRLQAIVGLPAIDEWSGVHAGRLHSWLTDMEFALLARAVSEKFGVGVVG